MPFEKFYLGELTCRGKNVSTHAHTHTHTHKDVYYNFVSDGKNNIQKHWEQLVSSERSGLKT